MSLTSGSDTLPSGRTGTVRLNSGFFQTEISSTSSGPIWYAFARSIGVGTAALAGRVAVGTVGGVSDGVAAGDAGVGAASAGAAAAGAAATAVSTGVSAVAGGTSIDVRGSGSCANATGVTVRQANSSVAETTGFI